jgi:signal transduction histidine kinase
MTTDASEAIRSARMQAVLQRVPMVLSANAVNATLITALLIYLERNGRVWWWLVANFLLVALRWAAYRMECGTPGLRRTAALVMAGSAASGLLWGGLGTFGVAGQGTYWLFSGFVVGGMCSGATSAYAAHFPSAALFILPATLPVAVRMLLEGQALPVAGAFMVLLFTGSLLRLSWMSHQSFGRLFMLQGELAARITAIQLAEASLAREKAAHQATETTLHHLQKIEAIGHLTSGLAHDLNNALGAALGNVELALKESEGAARRQLQSAIRAIEHGSQLVGSLVRFGRLESEAPGPVDVAAALTEFLPLLERAAAPCVIRAEIAPELPGCIAEAAQLQAAVLNLVINARDASEAGGAIVLSAAARSDPASPRRWLAITVADAGAGMTDEVRGRAFDPFYTTKPPGRGSGIGLPQVLAFVRRGGGRVDVKTAPGQGTSVTMLLPEASDD